MTDTEINEVPRTPDYRVGNFLLLVSQFCDLCRRAGVDSAAFLALSELNHDCYRAILIRGARMGALVDAIREVPGSRKRLRDMPIMDFKVASVALWVSERGEAVRALGIDFEIFERVRLLAQAVHDAIAMRGALVLELIEAIKCVRPHGSILDDLPSIQAKLRAENPK